MGRLDMSVLQEERLMTPVQKEKTQTPYFPFFLLIAERAKAITFSLFPQSISSIRIHKSYCRVLLKAGKRKNFVLKRFDVEMRGPLLFSKISVTKQGSRSLNMMATCPPYKMRKKICSICNLQILIQIT